MIKCDLSIDKMPCNCNKVCSTTTFDWHVVITVDNQYFFKVSCKTCSKTIESPARALITLNASKNSNETEAASPVKKFPTTIKEAKEDLDKYLASVAVNEEDSVNEKKEYVH